MDLEVQVALLEAIVGKKPFGDDENIELVKIQSELACKEISIPMDLIKEFLNSHFDFSLLNSVQITLNEGSALK